MRSHRKSLSSRFGLLALAAGLTLPFAACEQEAGKGGPNESGSKTGAVKSTEAKVALPGFLKYVPADTPYVFANLEPAPKAVFDKIMAKLDPIMGEMGGLLDAELAKPASEDPSEKVGRAILEEMKGHLSQKGLEELGLSAQTRMVVYGIGVLPAIRMELKSPDLFRAAVSRVEAKSGQKLVVTKTGDVEHWIIDKGKGFFVAGIQGNDLVLGMGPAKAKDAYLPVLFGVKKPAAGTLEDGGALRKLIDDYKFTPHGAGYLDVKSLASFFTDTATGLNGEIAALLRLPDEPDEKPEPPVPEECKTEIAALTDSFPRVVFGYEEMNDQGMVADLVLETKLGREIGALAVSVPGLTATPSGNPVFIAGLGIDLEKTKALITAKATAVTTAPFKCPLLAGLNEAATGALVGVNQPIPPFVNMVKGLSLVVKDAKMASGVGTSNPMAALDDAKAYLTIVSPSPAELLGIAKVMLPPNLAAIVVAPDGKPVALPTEGLLPFIKAPTVTMTATALAVTVGEGMQSEIAEILAKPPATNPPLLVIGYHLGKVMAAMNEKLMSAIATLPPDQKAKMEADLKRNKAVAELIGLVGFSLHATERGIEFKPRVNWN